MPDTEPGFPEHSGASFTKTIHSKAEGPTDPEKVKLPPDFTVLIVGASTGIGKNIAIAYAKAGAKNIIIASRSRDHLEKLTAELEKINPSVKVLARTCDIMKDEDVERLAGETKLTFEHLDVVVSNAGIMSKYLEDADGSNPRLPMGIVEATDFPDVIGTNLLGTYRVARNLLPLLASSHRGPQSFVVVTSIASQFADSSVTPVAYNLSKIACNRMVEHIHNDHFDKEGIVAFAVHPGAVLTPQTDKFNTTQKGDWWDKALVDDIGLCGGFLTWLTQEKREWLSGRYLASTWDVEELETMKETIVKEDKLRFRMVV